jgi:hypothetical protein
MNKCEILDDLYICEIARKDAVILIETFFRRFYCVLHMELYK